MNKWAIIATADAFPAGIYLYLIVEKKPKIDDLTPIVEQYCRCQKQRTNGAKAISFFKCMTGMGHPLWAFLNTEPFERIMTFPMKQHNQEGQYLTMTFTDDTLTMTPNVEELKSDYVDFETAVEGLGGELLLEGAILEDFLCNGWEWLDAGEIGALTSAPIISDDCERNDDNELTRLGVVYAFMNYQVISWVEELFKGNTVEWERNNGH